MSKMKSPLAAILLTLVFAFPTVGGNIGSPGGSGPPPPPPTSDGELGSTGQPQPIDLAGNAGPQGLSSPLIVDILMALLSVL
jgi:hypothetical protein